MIDNEKISVVVPVYNVEKYLNKCLQSIINQTYKNLEIILIDDGSTDNSGLICENFAQKDNRISVIHKKNGGLSEARNVGISNSTGDYLVFIDSDDYIHVEFIEQLYNALKSADADLSICNSSKVFDNGQIINDGILQNEIISGKQALQRLIEKKNVRFVVAWNKLYKRKLFDTVKYPINRINEDDFVIHRILGQCNKIACINNSLYFYFQHSDSIMGKLNKKSAEYLLNKSDFLIDRIQYFNSLQMNDCATKVYWNLVKIYLSIIKHKYNKIEKTEIIEKIKLLKIFLRKNYSFSKNLSLKRRIIICLIIIFNL